MGIFLKKAIGIILFFVITVAFSITSFANNGIKIYFNGEEIKSDTQPYIENSRTLVPVIIMEQLGYSVKWNATQRTVLLTKDNANIKLTIDSNIAYVNEKKVVLEANAKIKDSRTFVPLRFIAENFGYDVVWNGEKNSVYISAENNAMKITKVTTESVNSSFVVKVQGTKEIQSVSKMVLENPKRYVFDIKNAQLVGDNKEDAFNSDILTSIRYAQFSVSPKTVRVVVQLKADTTVNAQYVDGAYCIFINGGELPVVPPKPQPPTNNSKPLIVIDPGHGGTEPGSLGKIDEKIVLYEKDVNLKIGKKVYEKLLSDGYNVIATRTDDSTVSLARRAEIANEANASLFVSIHNNSFTQESAKGTLTMYGYDTPKENQTVSGKEVASIIQPYLVAATQSYDRKLTKNPSIYVINKTKMPSVLLECLFMSNKEDLQKLMNDDYIEQIATGIYSGIKKAMEKFN